MCCFFFGGEDHPQVTNGGFCIAMIENNGEFMGMAQNSSIPPQK
jgi:hypothetical protein